MNFAGRMSQGMLLSLSICMAASAQTVLTDDSFASSSTPKKNYGDSAALIVTAGSNMYLRFSLANLAGTSAGEISAAYLQLYIDTVQKTGTIDVYTVNGPWSENGITYNTAPPLGNLLLRGVPVSQAGFLSLNLTGVVQQWMVNPNTNYGIALTSTAGNLIAVSFDSKENTLTSHAPQLYVSLASIGPQGPQGVQGPPGPIGPQGPMPIGAALTGSSNTFTGNQTVNGNLVVSGGVQFADGTVLTTASTSAGSASGDVKLSFSPVTPQGYSAIGTTTMGNTWTEMAPIPTPRQGLAAAAVNGKIYAIGGLRSDTALDNTSSDYLNSVEVYDPSSNTWASAAPMPTPRDYLAAVELNGKIYAMGGYYVDSVGNLSILHTIEVYDPSSNTWSSGASMPTARYDFAATAVNGKIYAIGGSLENDNDVTLYRVDVYEPISNTWTSVALISNPGPGLAAVPVSGKIYVIVDSLAQVYDPASNTWNSAASMPTAVVSFSSVAANGKIYAIGGYNMSTEKILNTVQVYDPSFNTWTSAAPMPTARTALAAAEASGFIYTLGGVDASGLKNAVEQYMVPVPLYIFLKN